MTGSSAVQAAFDLGLAHLVGQAVPRDLAKARMLFREALAAGHGEAGLFEAALAANGSGAPPDWPHALATLRQAARTTAAAQAQLDLLAAMDLDDEGNPQLPTEAELLAESPRVWRAPRLLSPAECEHLARSAADLLEPSVVLDPVSGQARRHPVRTSDAATIGPTRQDVAITALLRRVAALTGTAFECGETVSLLRYAPGQEYRPHTDAIPHGRNQREWTVLLYLNEGYVGGETHFPAANLTVPPRGGDAVFFRNVLDDGSSDPATLHAGLPVRGGVKWLATRWIRERPFDPWSGDLS